MLPRASMQCVLATAMACLGCGGGETAAPPQPSLAPAVGTFQSGSRLRAAVWVGDAGGARLFAGWRDTALDVGCTFQRAQASGGLPRPPPGPHARPVPSFAR